MLEIFFFQMISRCLSQAFNSEHEVKNYPLKERSEKELEDLHRVENMRTLEKAASIVSKTDFNSLWF